MGKPAVGRGVELPEFADFRALPAAHGGPDLLCRDGMGEIVFQCPAADLGAVELEGVQAEGFGSGEAVGAWGRAGQPFFEEFEDGLRPGCRMVAVGSAGGPERCLLAGAGGVVSGGQRVEAAAGEAELLGGLRGVQGVEAEAFKDMTNERGRVTMNELLVLFKARRLCATRPAPTVFSRARHPPPPGFGCARLATLAFAPPHPGGGGRSPSGPVVQTSRVLFC